MPRSLFSIRLEQSLVDRLKREALAVGVARGHAVSWVDLLREAAEARLLIQEATAAAPSDRS